MTRPPSVQPTIFGALSNSPTRGRTPRARGAAALAAIALVACAAPAWSQAIDTTMWVANGTVNAVVRSGSTIYLGGDFTRVGPASGGGLLLSATTGAPVVPFPKVAGFVRAVVSDGMGGWYLGGTFTAVGDLPRANLAHVLANGNVAAWNPGTNNDVLALALIGGTVYAGGQFSQIGGTTRHALAAIDTSTGGVTAWDPNPSGGFPVVRALAVSGVKVYVGGAFTSIGGQTRNHIAALDATVNTNNALGWDPNANADVYALAVAGSTVYAGGVFTNIGGQTRNRIAALDATANTNNAFAWDPNANGSVVALIERAGRIYASGGFTNIGGQTRGAVAVLDSTLDTNNATAWDPGTGGTNLYGAALAVNGMTLYVGGNFTSIGGKPRNDLAALDLTLNTGNATAWNPDVNATVNALAIGTGTVYAGGFFTGVGGVTRNRLAAIDAATGIATSWNPNSDGSIYTIAVIGSSVYVGGTFNNVGGQTRTKLAALDATTGLANSWNPSASSGVQVLLASGSTLYVGGGFTNVGGQPRNHLAALDATTGAATAWDPNVNDWVLALALNGSTLYAGGYFTTVGGEVRNSIAGIDVSTAAPNNFDPDATGGTIDALAVIGGTVYAGGYFSTIGRQTRFMVAGLNPANGDATGWIGDADLSVKVLLANAGTLYAGGDFSYIGGQFRSRLAALDPTTGAATIWNANASAGSVLALASGGTSVYAGGVFNGVGVHPQAYFAAMGDLTTGTLVVRFDAAVESDGVMLRWQLASALTGATTTLERAETETGPWQVVAAASQVRAGVDEALDREALPQRAYWYRLQVRLADGSVATFGPIRAERPQSIAASGLTLVAPNPSSGPTRIEYVVAQRENARVSVVDVAGREVGVLFDGALEPGRYSALWDGTSAGGRALAAGMYFVRWRSPGRAMERSVAIVR